MLASVLKFSQRNDFFMKKMVLSSLILSQNITEVKATETNSKVSLINWEEPLGFDTNISIYNPIIKKKTKLILQNKNLVKWYSCGPTVYDSAHIGHASSYVKLDIIRRILEKVFDINVFYLLGVTDIDDKIILRSNEAKEDFRKLAHRYELEFFKDLESLNVLPPTMKAKVSDHIPEIISFVDNIVKKGHGYKAPSGSVYFAAEGFPGYGKLYPPQLSDAPEKPNAEKRSPLDFTLWKAAKPQEPHWQSPWGPGRPGWHIECSAMASQVLGSRLDIHSGGQDLIFPHHENEEAQSRARHDSLQWVNYWIHTGHLLVKGEVKMSKSLKNTISISDLLKSYTSNQFRMLCLLSPYRNRIEYSSEAMNTAIGNCRRIESFVDDCTLYLTGVRKMGVVDEFAILKSLEETQLAVRTHLADDFDTPRAMDVILHFVSSVNSMLSKPVLETKPRNVVAVAAASQFIKRTLSNLGFTFAERANEANSECLSIVLDAAVELRSCVREVALGSASKPHRLRLLQACDSLRNSLSQAGVELKDHGSQKTTWSLKDIVSPSSQ